MKNVLEVKNICKTYQAKNGEIEALRNISFSVKEGEYISIIGPSRMWEINIIINNIRIRK